MLKKILVINLILLISILPVNAKEITKFQARMLSEFSLVEETPKFVEFTSEVDIEIKDYIKIRGSGVTMDELNSILEENTTEINNEINNADSSVITNDDIDSIFA